MGPPLPAPLLLRALVGLRPGGPALATSQEGADAISRLRPEVPISVGAPGKDDGATRALIVAPAPSAAGPLRAALEAVRDALEPGGLAVVSDLVWQTAPSAELLRAFAPLPGREKVRPIEGYEMLLEDLGFGIVERHDVGPRDLAESLAPSETEKISALRSDVRGAAKLATWLLRRGD